jgi:hypothetical protein
MREIAKKGCYSWQLRIVGHFAPSLGVKWGNMAHAYR